MLAVLFQTLFVINLSIFLCTLTNSIRLGTNRKSYSNKFVMITKSTNIDGISNIIIPRIGLSDFSSQNVFHHMDNWDGYSNENVDDKKKQDFNLNVGRALEVLRRELPMVFYVSNHDFSVFANQITVCDGSHKSRVVMQKSLYSAAVKSLRVASSVSFTYPSMNVRKIEYIESCRTIQCNVDIVLPDTIRIDGQALWEGMFFFGLDETGLINTHIFDRKVSNLRPSPQTAHTYPWLRASPSWSADLLVGVGGGMGAEFPQSVMAADFEARAQADDTTTA